MTNLAAVLHNLLDAIEDGDMDEIKSAAKLAKLAAPSADTEDTGGLADWEWGLYDVNNPRIVTGFASFDEAEGAIRDYDNDTVNGNWYATRNPAKCEVQAHPGFGVVPTP